MVHHLMMLSFNTASGRYYCNAVSIAVSESAKMEGFNTASGRYYCNEGKKSIFVKYPKMGKFQYRKR